MGLTKIEWAHYTFNPWIGCTKVDELCTHCYAERDDKRRKWTPEGWGKGKPRRQTSAKNWQEPLKWDTAARIHRFYRCDRCARIVAVPECSGTQFVCPCGGDFHEQRPRVFCASLADVFDEEVDDQWRWDLLSLIQRTPNLDWLLLTKRPAAARRFLARVADWPWPNVWLGTSAGTQKGFDERARELISIPARVRFLSMEPLLEAVRINRLQITECGFLNPLQRDIHWVIAGGESGPGARPTHPDWLRALRDQCAPTKTPFFFKQWGEWAPRSLLQIDGKPYGGGTDFAKLDPQCKQWPHVIRLGEHGKDTRICENCTPDAGEEIYVQRVGKLLAGRVLDGVEHNAVPIPRPLGVFASWR